MKTETIGKLKKSKNGFRLALPTKKGGVAEHDIPEAARRFKLTDGSDGLEVDVTLDDAHKITKVTIPGKPEVGPTITPPPSKPYQKHGGPRGPQTGSNATAVRKLRKAPPKVFGSPFHNPYTFLPFGQRSRARQQPTAWSADELGAKADRLTGVLELEITTVSPLLTCHPQSVEESNRSKSNEPKKAEHNTFEVLRIGNDVIVPATGIRGSLRTLLTILTGGTLGYLNTNTNLCQGRDAKLGPAVPTSPPNIPANPFLAEVAHAGNEFCAGKVRVGRTELVLLDDLEECWKQTHRGGGEMQRGVRATPYWVGLDFELRPIAISEKHSPETPWQLKLSGRPINRKGKREGVVLLDAASELELRR